MMKSITRRNFLKAMAVSCAMLTAGCTSKDRDTQNGPKGAEDAEKWVKGVCRYCGTGCGVLAGVKGNKIVAVKGDPDCAVNKGRLCVKGILLPKIINTKDRVLHPLIKKNGEFVEASWDEALDLIVSKIKESVDQYGPDSIGFYGSGQTFAEETYVAQKVIRAGIGTNNIDGNPRTCMASAVAGFMTSFGEDEPSGTYADIEEADTFFIIGANPAEAHPVLFSRLIDRKNANPDVKVIVADPRKTRTGDIADYYLEFIPGRDLALLNSMAQVIIEENLINQGFIDRHTEFMKGTDKLSFDEYKAFLQDYTPEKVEAVSGIPAQTIREVARLFAAPGRKTMSLWCMGLNQRTRGVWVNNLVHNLHLLTGKICSPGNSSFSLTGQPSACGSVRETGGLSHILPAHRLVANAKHREELAKIWGIDPARMPSKPGYHTLAMFKAAVEGKLKFLWVMCTNPGQSLPNLEYYRPGMEKTFMVVSEAYHPTRTSELADVVLPAALWMEKEGVYGNGERRTQHLAKAIDPPGEAKPDLEVLIEVAKRLGYEELVPFKTPEDVWKEYQKCQEGTAMQLASYGRLRKEHGLTWPVPGDDKPETYIRYARPWDPYVKEDAPDGIEFYGRPNGRAVIWARPQVDPQENPDVEYPFYLTTGRILEHWHTGTMTFNVPELKNVVGEMYVEIHPEDAASLGIAEGDEVDVISRRATCTFKAHLNGRGRPRKGLVYVPFHDQVKERMINRVLLDAFDAASKQPEYKVCAVRLQKHQA
jgi:nitrate reductase NapA